MKCIIFLILVVLSYYSYGQERVNTERPKLEIKIEGYSHRLEKVIGYSRHDFKEGKKWVSTPEGSNKNYIPLKKELRTHGFQEFNYIQFYKLLLEGEIFYFAVVKYPSQYSGKFIYSVYAFTNEDMQFLQNLIKYNDDTYYYKALKIRYTADFENYSEEMIFDPEVLLLKDKNMIRALLLDEKATSDDLFGYSFLIVNSQFLIGEEDEQIVRFLIAPTCKTSNYVVNIARELWKGAMDERSGRSKVYDMYFETTHDEFSKIFNFKTYYSQWGIEQEIIKPLLKAEAKLKKQLKYKYITYVKLNVGLYSEPNDNLNKRIYSCPKNSTVYVIDNSNDYYKVSVDGHIGYINYVFLAKKE